MALSDWIGGGIVGGQGNYISSFLHPERGYEHASDELRRSWLEAKDYLTPYSNAGKNMLPGLRRATNSLLNPEQLENKWASGYETSPYALDELKRSQGQGLDAASAMGLSGSSAALENIQRTGSGIVNADRRNYLQDLMQKYLAGVNSAQNIFGTGANAASTLSQGALNTGQNQAQMAYGAQNAPGEMFARIIGQFLNGGGKAMMGGF